MLVTICMLNGYDVCHTKTWVTPLLNDSELIYSVQKVMKGQKCGTPLHDKEDCISLISVTRYSECMRCEHYGLGLLQS